MLLSTLQACSTLLRFPFLCLHQGLFLPTRISRTLSPTNQNAYILSTLEEFDLICDLSSLSFWVWISLYNPIGLPKITTSHFQVLSVYHYSLDSLLHGADYIYSFSHCKWLVSLESQFLIFIGRPWIFWLHRPPDYTSIFTKISCFHLPVEQSLLKM